jgi:hypothetical protein
MFEYAFIAERYEESMAHILKDSSMSEVTWGQLYRSYELINLAR